MGERSVKHSAKKRIHLPNPLSQPARISQTIDRKHTRKIIAFKTILEAFPNYAKYCFYLRWGKGIHLAD